MISHSYIFQCCVTDSTHWGQASQWPIASCRWNCCGKPCFVWHFVMRTIPSYRQWRSRKSFFPTSWLRQTCFVFFVLCRCLYSAECPANFHCKGKLLFEQLMYWIPLDYSDDVSKVCFAASSTPSRIVFFISLSFIFLVSGVQNNLWARFVTLPSQDRIWTLTLTNKTVPKPVEQGAPLCLSFPTCVSECNMPEFLFVFILTV